MDPTQEEIEAIVAKLQKGSALIGLVTDAGDDTKFRG
jgi:hypothetical protein